MEIRVDGDFVTFWMRVKPRSSRERLSVNGSGELQLELRAPPTEGRANAACIEFLARLLRAPRSSMEIVAGEKSRRKLIRIRGARDVERILRSAVAAPNSTH